MNVDDNLKQMSKMLDDFSEYSRSLEEVILKTAVQLEGVFSKERLESYQRIAESIQKYDEVINLLNSNEWKNEWEETYEEMSQFEKDFLEFLKQMNEENIYLNFYYFDSVPLDEIETLLDREVAIKWMNINLEKAVSYLSNRKYLARHKKLIEQSYRAYTNGDYELAILGIIPPLEFFMGNWIDSEKNNREFDLENPSRLQMNIKHLIESLKLHPDKDKKSLLIDHYFELKAIEGMKKFYDGSNRFSRHSIVHGSHEYDSLEKFDYVKLVYLFNSLLSLYGVDFKKV